MTIALTTPTGNVGTHLVRLLIQAGERPRVLVRNAGSLPAEVRHASDVVEVDQGDRTAVVAATVGVDTLYWVDPPTEDDDPIAGYTRMGRSGAAAIRENGIRRVVFQSSGGAEARSGFGEIDGLGATEDLFDETGADVIHLRCGYFYSNLLMDADSIADGRLTTTLPVDLHFPWVDPRDIASVAATRLLSSSWHGHLTQGVHGPADLSFADVASVLSRTLGHPVVAIQRDENEVAAELEGFGIGKKRVDGILGMARGIRSGFPLENPRSVLTTTPIALAAWAAEHFGGR